MKLKFYRKTRTFLLDDRQFGVADNGLVPLVGTYQTMIVVTRDGSYVVEFVVIGGRACPLSDHTFYGSAFESFLTEAKKLILERGHVTGLRVPKRESTFAHKAQAEEVAKLIAREMAWENRP